MTTFRMYVANTHGQKLSGYTPIEAASLGEARAAYRKQLQAKKFVLRHVELLAAV